MEHFFLATLKSIIMGRGIIQKKSGRERSLLKFEIRFYINFLFHIQAHETLITSKKEILKFFGKNGINVNQLSVYQKELMILAQLCLGNYFKSN